MKAFLLVAFLAFVSCDIDLKTFDWSTVKPLAEIEEWRNAHPNFEARTAHPSTYPPRPRRILNGDIANRFEYPYVAGVMLHFNT